MGKAIGKMERVKKKAHVTLFRNFNGLRNRAIVFNAVCNP